MTMSYRQVAAELAVNIGKLVDQYLLTAEAGPRGRVGIELVADSLRRLLWDNKINILQIIKNYAKGDAVVQRAIEMLRRAIIENAALVERLHGALADQDALQQLAHELDANNADLHVALEEIAEYPPPSSPLPSPEDGDNSPGGPTSAGL